MKKIISKTSHHDKRTEIEEKRKIREEQGLKIPDKKDHLDAEFSPSIWKSLLSIQNKLENDTRKK